MTKQEIIMELMMILHGITEGMITETTAIEMLDDLLERSTLDENEKSSSIIHEEFISNKEYTTTTIAKIILDKRNKELNKINKRLDVILQEKEVN